MKQDRFHYAATEYQKDLDLGELFQTESEHEKNKGLAKVTGNNETWLEQCVEHARKYVLTRDMFTGEDIRFHCEQTVGYPKHPNAWGALTNALIKRGIIQGTGFFKPMLDPRSHARITPIYKKK